MHSFTVKEPMILFEALQKGLGAKREKIKSLLRHKAVSVNGTVISQFNHPVRPGDTLAVWTDTRLQNPKARLASAMKVLYEDDAIAVVDKPPGLLTISTDTVKEKTAFYELNEYLKAKEFSKRPGRRVPGRRASKQIFIVHRLDREASGLIVFARTLAAKLKLQGDWSCFEKIYAAVVEGKPERTSGVIETYLKEDDFLRVYVMNRPAPGAKLSRTHYRVLKSNGRYSLMEFKLETGRKHQIRVHAAEIGHPIVGEDRYSKISPPENFKRLALHACRLTIEHPATGKRTVFESPVPPAFEALVK